MEPMDPLDVDTLAVFTITTRGEWIIVNSNGANGANGDNWTKYQWRFICDDGDSAPLSPFAPMSPLLPLQMHNYQHYYCFLIGSIVANDNEMPLSPMEFSRHCRLCHQCIAIGTTGIIGITGAIEIQNVPFTLSGDRECGIAIDWFNWVHYNVSNGRPWRSPLVPMEHPFVSLSGSIFH